MTDKSHVGMEQKVCHICGVTYDTGAILLDKRLRNSLDPKVVTGWGMCDECGAKIGDDYIALVEVAEPPAWMRDTLKPDEANRTGNIAWVKRHVFRAIFNRPDTGENDKPLSMVFVQPGLIEQLQQMENNRKQIEGDSDGEVETDGGADEAERKQASGDTTPEAPASDSE